MNTNAPQKPVEGQEDTSQKKKEQDADKVHNPIPMSEKDEVKEAERRMREGQNK